MNNEIQKRIVRRTENGHLVSNGGGAIAEGSTVYFICNGNYWVNFGSYNDTMTLCHTCPKDFFLRNTIPFPEKPEIKTRYATKDFCEKAQFGRAFVGEKVFYRLGAVGLVTYSFNNLEHGYMGLGGKMLRESFMALTTKNPPPSYSSFVEYAWQLQKIRIIKVGATVSGDGKEWATIGGFNGHKEALFFSQQFMSIVFAEKSFGEYLEWIQKRIDIVNGD